MSAKIVARKIFIATVTDQNKFFAFLLSTFQYDKDLSQNWTHVLTWSDLDGDNANGCIVTVGCDDCNQLDGSYNHPGIQLIKLC